MKKRRLFTVLAAVALLTASGAAVTQSMTTPVHAAAKKSSKTSLKSYKITVKRGAALYGVKRGKGVSAKITALKYRGRKLTLRGGSLKAYFTDTQGKTTYYYLGNEKVGTTTYAVYVRSQDVKTSKEVPSLQDLNKARVGKYSKKLTAYLNTLPKFNPPLYLATLKESTQYVVYDPSTKSFTTSNDQWNQGKSVDVIYQANLTETSKTDSSQKTSVPFYAVVNPDSSSKNMIFVPTEAVTLNNANAQVPSQESYNQSYQTYVTNTQNKAKAYAAKLVSKKSTKKTSKKAAKKSSKKSSKKVGKKNSKKASSKKNK